MLKYLRIHGDNIVECERILNIILYTLPHTNIIRSFSSKACMSVKLQTNNGDELFFELFPGFNKSTSDRWNMNILDILTQQGSFLDETPDAILTEVIGGYENILIAIEFCSALQAGNQAWQRSGRAYSTARTRVCPYLYIVDFVKYELDTNTRKRKALRFPNPSIPYSYINNSNQLKIPVLQAFFRSEEFQPSFDSSLSGFNPLTFGEIDVSKFIIELIYHLPTTTSVNALRSKNYEMVKFTAKNSKNNSFSISDWDTINHGTNIIDYIKISKPFNFKKKIAEKSIGGNIRIFNELVSNYSIGIASSDLPFGLIPGNLRPRFIKELGTLYKITDSKFYTDFSSNNDLIVCMLKGFKPGGDDNRPDRGLLPFISMLVNEKIEILTFIYGPILKYSLNLFDTNIRKLAQGNGLWKSFIALSNYIIIDSPVIGSGKMLSSTNQVRISNNSGNKQYYLNQRTPISSICVSTTPTHYSENDVDTLMHTILRYLTPNCFEGLCNPPGGDWSGLSIVDSLTTGNEYRWLSLPRVSPDGKRPDHVFTLIGLLDKPLIITIESKENALNLETDIGQALKNYIMYLFDFIPSVERPLANNNWQISKSKLSYSNYYCVSIGCFLAPMTLDLSSINIKCKCDILIAYAPHSTSTKWSINIKYFTPLGKVLTDYIITSLAHNTSPLNIFV